jgi:hypothetical protein
MFLISARISGALPRQGRAEISDSAGRDNVFGGTPSDAQIWRTK